MNILQKALLFREVVQILHIFKLTFFISFTRFADPTFFYLSVGRRVLAWNSIWPFLFYDAAWAAKSLQLFYLSLFFFFVCNFLFRACHFTSPLPLKASCSSRYYSVMSVCRGLPLWKHLSLLCSCSPSLSVCSNNLPRSFSSETPEGTRNLSTATPSPLPLTRVRGSWGQLKAHSSMIAGVKRKIFLAYVIRLFLG